MFEKIRRILIGIKMKGEELELRSPIVFKEPETYKKSVFEMDDDEEDNENVESPKRPKADHPLNICVDFDGVIHQYSRGWKDGKIYDDPVYGAISGMAKLQRKGFSIIIFTARTDFLGIGKWLKEWDVNNEIDFDKIIITGVKIPAIAYIDDRAIRFTNWQDMINYF